MSQGLESVGPEEIAESTDSGRPREPKIGLTAASPFDAPGTGALSLDVLEALGMASYLGGRDRQAVEAWTNAFQLSLESEDLLRAVRSAFWLAFAALQAGDFAKGSGWIERVQRILDGSPDCPEQGHLQYLTGLRSVFRREPGNAHASFVQAVKIGERFGDRDVMTLGRIGRGRCLIYLGEPAEAVSLFDEAMVAVAAGEVSGIVAGNSYCTVIEGCQEIFDVQRAQEWTRQLSEWCDDQSEATLYRGVCLVHRAEIMFLHGDWADTHQEVARAFEELGRNPVPRAMGPAYYLLGELERLQGRPDRAGEAYENANRWGREPQPGRALLLVDQGDRGAALASLRRIADQSQGSALRGSVLPALVETAVDAGHNETARVAADDLAELAAELGSAALKASSHFAQGLLELSSGDQHAAAAELRQAWGLWHEIEVPYEEARTRARLAQAYRALGDRDGSQMELDAARRTFEALGALPQLARAGDLGTGEPSPGSRLTRRELEVLRLIAQGKSNRSIASSLFISESTVATHVGSVLAKLGVESRSAATAYAYEHGVVSPQK